MKKEPKPTKKALLQKQIAQHQTQANALAKAEKDLAIKRCKIIQIVRELKDKIEAIVITELPYQPGDYVQWEVRNGLRFGQVYGIKKTYQGEYEYVIRVLRKTTGTYASTVNVVPRHLQNFNKVPAPKEAKTTK